MLRCAPHHGRTGCTKLAARLLVLIFVATMGAAPIAASWHELTVGHFICSEHGELTHAPVASGSDVGPTGKVACVKRSLPEALAGHDHCSEGFVVPKRLLVSVVSSASILPAPPAIMRASRAIAVRGGRSFVLAHAPKTSPPSV
jgi:hypothetical protein